MEKEFRKITLTFGIIMAVLGALVIWRGVTKMIPVTGWVHGGLFTLGGLFFFLVGVALLVVPPLRARRKKKERGGAGKSVMKQVTIYTDGACSGNPGPGGWGRCSCMGAIERRFPAERPTPPTTAWSSPP